MEAQIHRYPTRRQLTRTPFLHTHWHSELDNDLLLKWVQESEESGTSSEIGLASALYQACFQTLAKVSQQYVAGAKASRAQKILLRDSYARLCLFGDDLVDDGGLESCLKLDEELSNDLITLLYNLGQVLSRGIDDQSLTMSVSLKLRDEFVNKLKDLLEKTSTIIKEQNDGNGDADGDSSSEDGDMLQYQDKLPAKELPKDDILRALNSYTQSLMDLRPLLDQMIHDIRNHPPTTNYRNQIMEFKVTDAAQTYVRQVHDKFRTASTYLVERLGEANWQRYMRLRAAMDGVVPSDDVPKSSFQPASVFHDSGIGASIPSTSRYAASNVSHTSYLSTATETSKGKARVPKTPAEVGQGIPFACFICSKKLTTIKNRVDWKMHVFADLSPYVCTFRDCSKLLHTYSTRKLWSEHEFTEHRSRRYFECHDCSTELTQETDFVKHLQADHGQEHLNHTQLLATLAAAKKSVMKPLDNEECPLCKKEEWTSHREFVTHLSRHLEEIALSTLFRESDTDLDSDSVSDDDERNNKTMPPARQQPAIEQDKDLVEDSDDEPILSSRGRQAPRAFPDPRPEILDGFIVPSPPLEDEPEETFKIKCICTYKDDDGNTVFCEGCDTWQHIECYYHGRSVPDEHFCTDCRPELARAFDPKKATERQRRLRMQKPVKSARSKT